MHIHGSHNIQLAALVPTQSAQQASAARKAAAEVRRKLAALASTAGAGAISHIDAYTPGDRRRRDPPPQEEDSFRKVLVSIQP
jgi:predicted aconitase